MERAIRFIEQGALDDGDIDKLAASLGTGSRHLRRLFQKHMAASPLLVAKTPRVQRAKRLLDQTDLPIAEVAMRSGFGSLRRINAVFVEIYRRSPTEIRKGQQS
jgi:AraC family transcriptional regulator of adaptative response/methylated-DNA-[protein]-cysteine methyltransferase